MSQVPFTFANSSGNIPLSRLDVNFANVKAFADTAGIVTANNQPNIKQLGVLNSLSVTGNITGANIIGTIAGSVANAVFAEQAGRVTSSAQPVITSVGTLTSLQVTGRVVAATYFGDGQNLTNLPVQPGDYSNANVTGFLPVYSGALGFGVSTGILSGESQESVFLGFRAVSNQGDFAVAVGSGAGEIDQQYAAVAIGDNAGLRNQGANAVAIGTFAGSDNQGENSIAIGYLSASSSQLSNSIVINASGIDLQTSQSGFHVAPVRNDVGNVTNNLYYNTLTREVTYAESVAAESVAVQLPAYADASARDTAIPIPSAGMMILTGTTPQIYVGSAWGNITVS